MIISSCEKEKKPELIETRLEKSTMVNPVYFTVEEFNQQHPEQKKLFESFSQRIKVKAVPVNGQLQTKRVTIAFIYPGSQVSDYWRRSMKSFKSRMDEIELKYRLIEFYSRAGKIDSSKQAEQLREVLEQDPDYLVFTLNVITHRNLIERILTKGRPKLILQNISTPLRAWEGKQPFLYVGFDHVIGSEILARYFIKQTGGNGQYAVLFFSEGYVSDMRGNTFIDYLNKHSDLKLLSAHYTEGQRVKAQNITLSILEKSNNLRFIYACSTDVALGAIDGLKKTDNLGKIAINGWGGGSSELDSILIKEMDVTVMRMNDDNGVAMAEAVRLDVEGKTAEVPKIYSGDFALVEKGISDSKLKQLQERAFRYSNN